LSPSIFTSEKVLVLQEKIKNNDKIEVEDQILFTKKGYRMMISGLALKRIITSRLPYKARQPFKIMLYYLCV